MNPTFSTNKVTAVKPFGINKNLGKVKRVFSLFFDEHFGKEKIDFS